MSTRHPPAITTPRHQEEVLAVENLSVERDDVRIVNDFSWRVRRGEHWVLLGRNGCGKTSVLRALVGYLSPTAGEIRLLGRRYGETDWRDLRLHVGVVSSALQPSIPPGECALETVVSGRYAQLDLWHSVTASDRIRARKWLRFFGAQPLASRPWEVLSQGERQKVLIARALMARPAVLILDEPCSGLDPVARQDFLGFVDALARHAQAPSLVLVTHHVEEITRSFTHALLMRNGAVSAAGKIGNTLSDENLSACFDRRVSLAGRRGRWTIRFKNARAG